MIVKNVGWFGFVMAGLVLTGLCRAELTIEISEGVDNPIPVAVVPFANRSVAPLPDDVRQIISDDLQRSGEFTSLDISRMLSLPSRGDEVRYRDWSLVGQSYLVIGDIEYSQIENVYSIRYELYDVFQEKFVVGQKYVVTADRLREVSHKISDRIYETITGVKGIFSTKIAYVTLNRDAKGKDDYRLYVADADGRHARMLLQTTEPVLSVAWSPNGQKLAYVSFETGRPAIYIQEVESGNRKTVSAYTGLNSAPAWSPDGKYLAMTLSKDGNAEIYKLNLETGQLQRLTNHYAIDTEPSWSPDGKSIVFTSDRSGGPQIYWMGVDGERQERLTFDGKYNARARYTGDNRQIIYVHQSDGAFNIASLDLSSNTQLILTQTPLDESPSMAPNGRMLIYATQRGRNGVLAVVSLDGKAKYFLPSSQGDVREPSWSPYVISTTPVTGVGLVECLEEGSTMKGLMAKTTLALVISTALLSGCGTTGNKAEGVPADDQQTSGTTFGAKNTGTLTAEELAAQQAETARKAEAERMARLAEAKSKEQAALRAIRTFYFDFDKYEIKSEATLALSAHAAFIAANPSVKVVVEGHADERGTKDYNLALGEKRAKAVERFLIVNGVARNQIESVSYGEERPAVMGHEESSWAKNRRAVIAY